MLNKHKRWFHSSRVKCPLVSTSANWFLVSTYLIFGSKLIRSNNLSRATLWVLETCLTVGLLPLTIILITASLPSNTNTKLLDAKIERSREHNQYYWKRWSSLEIACYARDLCHSSQRVAPFYRGSELCFQGQKQSDPANRERESRPISIQRPKRWFRILLNCTKLNFAHPTCWKNVWFPKTHCVPPEVDFESSSSPAKSESRNSSSQHCLAMLPT